MALVRCSGSGTQTAFRGTGFKHTSIAALCPVCGRAIPVRTDGKLYVHYNESQAVESMALGPGMAAKAAELGLAVTGAQLSGERFLKNPDGSDVFSFAVFERGQLTYFPGTGLTAFFRFL